MASEITWQKSFVEAAYTCNCGSCTLLAVNSSGKVYIQVLQEFNTQRSEKRTYARRHHHHPLALPAHHSRQPPAYPLDLAEQVGITGIPLDKTSYRTETDTLQVWDKEFEFSLRIPELALPCITVKDYDSNTQNDFAGQTCLPISEIRPGIRAVRLHDRAGEVYKHVRLLVRFVLEPR
ncbi:C2 domain protein [Raphanus sativus]|nr:C2 domain protein [Raphanus sativus]